MHRRFGRQALILDGRPACGKGTQAKVLKKYAEDLGFKVKMIATGDVIRAVNRGNTAEHPWDDFLAGIAPRVEAELPKMLAGELLSDEVAGEIAQYLFHRATEHSDPDIFILDGFPRTVEQVEKALELLAGAGVRNDVGTFVARIKVSREVCVERQLARASKEGRPDDANRQVIERRQDVYETSQYLVRELFRNTGVCFVEIRADTLEVSALTQSITHVFAKLFDPAHLGVSGRVGGSV